MKRSTLVILLLTRFIWGYAQGYYELEIEYRMVNETSHAVTCNSFIKITAYYKNGKDDVIRYEIVGMGEEKGYGNSFKFVCSSDNKIDRLLIETERNYDRNLGLGCGNGGGGTVWLRPSYSYPNNSAIIYELKGYGRVKDDVSYAKVTTRPLTNKYVLDLTTNFTSSSSNHWINNFGGIAYGKFFYSIINNKEGLPDNRVFLIHKADISDRIKNMNIVFSGTLLEYIKKPGSALPNTYFLHYEIPWKVTFPDIPFYKSGNEKFTEKLEAMVGLPTHIELEFEFYLKYTIDYRYISAPVGSSSKQINPDDQITLTASGGFPEDIVYWKYCVDNPATGTWKMLPLPSQQRTNNPKVKGKDLFGDDYSYLNKVIYFRYYLVNPDSEDYSSTVSVDYKKQGPTMQLVENIHPTCSYKNDGGFTIRFGRPLEPKESVNLEIKKGDDIINVSNITRETLNGGTVFTYREGLIHGGEPLAGLGKGEYLVSMVAKMDGQYDEYTGGKNDPLYSCTVTLTAPSPVTGTFEKLDVNCHSGNDGRISIIPSGGTGSYYAVYGEDTTSLFTSSGYTIHRFAPGAHLVKLFDSNHCHIGNDGDEVTLTISQPAAPVVLNTERIFQPRGWGLFDGWIKVRAQNGTAPPDGDYTFYWTKQDAGSIPAQSPLTEGNSMTNTAENLGDGRYHIRVEDIRYGTAVSLPGAVVSDWKGCVAGLDTVLVQPPKLEVTLATRDSISCFALEDGAIMAHARGGVGGPGTYEYEWVIKEGLSGIPISGGFIPDSVLQDLLSATYVVTVRDTNGITTTADYYLEQPELLTAAVATATLSCDGDTDGWVEAGVSGGTTPYQYVWTGYGTENATPRTTRIEGLTGGAYTLFVKDYRGCEAWSAGRVNVPGGMQLDTLVMPPVCHNTSDGSIVLNVSGGVAPYTYLWNTPATTSTLNNLPAGNYSVKITDANNCFIEQGFSLKNPEPLTIDLGDDRVLCKDQVAVLSAKILDANATYRWYNRDGLFAGEPEVEISGEGKYRVLVSNSDGCLGTDTVNISTRDMEIVADFVVAAKAAATIPTCFVNISHPFPESTEWIVPDEASVFVVSHTDEQLELLFNHEGEYTVGLLARVGECEQAIYKTITVVNKYDLTDYEPQQEAFLKQFKVWPNPSNGQFTVLVELNESADIQLRLISSAGTVMETRPLSGNDRYQETFSSNGKLQPGVYIMQLVSKKAVAAIQIVIENL